MAYWILKSEPNTYSFEDLEKNKRTVWDGVRNYQARNNLRAMKVGEEGLIYHSGDAKEIVGMFKVSKAAFKDPTSQEDWAAIEIVPIKKLKRSLKLSEIKGQGALKNMSLIKQSRLSVCPLAAEEFEFILKLSQKNQDL